MFRICLKFRGCKSTIPFWKFQENAHEKQVCSVSMHFFRNLSIWDVPYVDRSVFCLLISVHLFPEVFNCHTCDGWMLSLFCWWRNWIDTNVNRGIYRTGVAEEATRSQKPIGKLELSSSCWFSCCEVPKGFSKSATFWKKGDKKWLFENSFCKSCRSNDTFVYIWNRWICKLVWVKSGFSHCSCQFSIGQAFYLWVQACCWSSSQRRRFL